VGDSERTRREFRLMQTRRMHISVAMGAVYAEIRLGGLRRELVPLCDVGYSGGRTGVSDGRVERMDYERERVCIL